MSPAGCIADKSCDEIRFNVYRLFVVKFRGSWKLDMAYSNNLAQLSLHLKAKKKKTQEFLHQEI